MPKKTKSWSNEWRWKTSTYQTGSKVNYGNLLLYPPHVFNGTRGIRNVIHKQWHDVYKTSSELSSGPVWLQNVMQPLDSDAYNTARRRFVEKTWNNAEDWMAALDVYERAKTAAMLAKHTQTLCLAALQVATGNFIGASKTLAKDVVRTRKTKRNARRAPGQPKPPARVSVKQTFAENWMEYRYGIMPTVYSIRDAMNVLATPVTGGWIIARGTAIGSTGDNVTNSSFSYGYTGRKVRCTISGRVDINPVLAAAKLAGLMNLPALIYEGVPFSWMADWFFGLGDYLNSLDDFYGVALSGCSVTYNRSVFYEVKTSKTVTITGPVLVPKGTLLYTGVHRRKDRKLVSGLPIPQPEFGFNINGKRVTDLAALAVMLTEHDDRTPDQVRHKLDINNVKHRLRL